MAVAGLGRRSGEEIQERVRREAARAFSHLAHDWSLSIAIFVLGVLMLLAIFGPLVWRGATTVNIGDSLAAPSFAHPMGADSVGRDIFARFNQGARISLSVGAIVVVVGALVGGAIGILSGATGGWVDTVLMRIMDAILAFPPLILAMAVSVGLGAGLKSATLGITLTSLPYYARLLRSDVLRIRALPFIEAAHALGARRLRILLRHIVPHVASTLLIQAAALFGYAILTLAALGFVGLGAQDPTPEWGTMITDGLQYFLTGQWWIGVFPGIGLLLVVTATNIIADRARDILDPRGEYAHV